MEADKNKERPADSSSDSEEQLDDINDVLKDLEENGWYKGTRKQVEED